MSDRRFIIFIASVYMLGFMLEYKVYPYMMNYPLFWEQCVFSALWPPILIIQFIVFSIKYSFICLAYAIDNYLTYMVFSAIVVLSISLIPDKKFKQEKELEKCKRLLLEHGINIEE